MRALYGNGVRQRDALLDSALVLFAGRGYRGTSIREVASRASTTHATVLHHFGSKAGLLAALLERRLTVEQPARHQLVEQLGFPDAIVAVMRRNVLDRELLRLEVTLQAESADPSHPAHAYFQEQFRYFRSNVVKDMAAAQAEGLLRKDLPLEQTALQLLGLINGLQVQWAYDESVDIAACVASYMELLRP